VFFSAKWARAPHKVTRIALRLFGLTRRNVLGADLTGEIFGGNFAVAVHQDDKRLGVFVFHDERLDDVMVVNAAGRSCQRSTAVLFIFIGTFFKGNLVFLEPLRCRRKALMLFFGHERMVLNEIGEFCGGCCMASFGKVLSILPQSKRFGVLAAARFV
jgi:hypothetical protein